MEVGAAIVSIGAHAPIGARVLHGTSVSIGEAH